MSVVGGLITHWPLGWKIVFDVIYVVAWGLILWKFALPFSRWFLRSRRRVMGVYVFGIACAFLTVFDPSPVVPRLLGWLEMVIFGGGILLTWRDARRKGWHD